MSIGGGLQLDYSFAHHTRAVDEYLRTRAPQWTGLPISEAAAISSIFESNDQLWTPGFVLSQDSLLYQNVRQEYVQQYAHLLKKPLRQLRDTADQAPCRLDQYLQDSLEAALSQLPSTASLSSTSQSVASEVSLPVQRPQTGSGYIRMQADTAAAVAGYGTSGKQQARAKGYNGDGFSVTSHSGDIVPSGSGADWNEELHTKRKPQKAASADVKVMEHRVFFRCMLYGFILSLAMLPTMWMLEKLVLPLMRNNMSQYSTVLFAPLLLGITVQPLHECIARLLGLSRVLHFEQHNVEQYFLHWFGTSRMFMDIISHSLWFIAGACVWVRVKRLHQDSNDAILTSPVAMASLAGMVAPLMPAVLVLFSRWETYSWRREGLLIFSRTAFTMSLLYVHCMAPEQLRQHMTIPFVALAQLIMTVSMQIRLSAFIPTQLIYLLVVVVVMGERHSFLHTVQLCGFCFCLPALLLYSMEMYSRHAFAAIASKEGLSSKLQLQGFAVEGRASKGRKRSMG